MTTRFRTLVRAATCCSPSSPAGTAPGGRAQILPSSDWIPSSEWARDDQRRIGWPGWTSPDGPVGAAPREAAGADGPSTIVSAGLDPPPAAAVALDQMVRRGRAPGAGGVVREFRRRRV